MGPGDLRDHAWIKADDRHALDPRLGAPQNGVTTTGCGRAQPVASPTSRKSALFVWGQRQSRDEVTGVNAQPVGDFHDRL